MSRVSIEDVVKNTKTLSFSFTNTSRGENISMPGGCTIDLNGDIFGSPSSSVTVIGGNAKHVFAKEEGIAEPFYLNEYQKATINALVYGLAIRQPFEGKIEDGNNEGLNYLASAAFENFRA